MVCVCLLISFSLKHIIGFRKIMHIIPELKIINNKKDAYSRTGGIFIRDTARDTAYSLRFNEV